MNLGIQRGADYWKKFLNLMIINVWTRMVPCTDTEFDIIN